MCPLPSIGQSLFVEYLWRRVDGIHTTLVLDQVTVYKSMLRYLGAESYWCVYGETTRKGRVEMENNFKQEIRRP